MRPSGFLRPRQIVARGKADGGFDRADARQKEVQKLTFAVAHSTPKPHTIKRVSAEGRTTAKGEQIRMTENEEKRLQALREKMSQLKAREQAIVNRDKERQRKERTRRLIQNGALAEKYLNCEGMNPEKFELVLKTLVGKLAL